MDNYTAKNEEIIEVWDWDSACPLGIPISRDEAHKKGIPHEGVHLWVIRIIDKIPEVLFQKRASFKKSYPGYLDITVGGHVPFGLKENKIQKEALEEIGISFFDEQLIDLGLYRHEGHEENNVLHREFPHVYMLKDNRSLDEYSFNDGEVTALAAIPLPELVELLAGKGTCNSTYYDGSNIEQRVLHRNEFHPLLFDSGMKKYMSIIMQAAQELTGGKTITVKMFT